MLSFTVQIKPFFVRYFFGGGGGIMIGSSSPVLGVT